LHNIVQHAGASNVGVSVGQDADGLALNIHDDGKGFDPRRQRGMGLLGIEERVGYLGGTFAVESLPGQGTTLRVRLPLSSGTPEQAEVA
jgi:signal transduction histidine kinase